MKRVIRYFSVFVIGLILSSCSTSKTLSDAYDRGVGFLSFPERMFILQRSDLAKKSGLIKEGEVYSATQTMIVDDKLQEVDIELYEFEGYIFYSVDRGCIYHIQPAKSSYGSTIGYKIPILIDGVSIKDKVFKCSSFGKVIEPYQQYAKLGVTSIQKQRNSDTVELINRPMQGEKTARIILKKQESSYDLF